jgi:hypothetical protein
MGLLDRFRKTPTALAPANVGVGWTGTEEWHEWDAPGNFISGESHYKAALTALAGPPRQEGYLIPVKVAIVREPTNAYDSNAFRAEVDGRHVGYLSRHIAAQLAGPLDAAGCGRFEVCGVLRGGSVDAPNIGIHVWLSRRLSQGPEIMQRDEGGLVSWPPYDDEGKETPSSSGRRRASPGVSSDPSSRSTGTGPGYLRGNHYTEYTDQVKELRRSGLTDEAEELLLELITATEAEAKAKNWGVAPWYYEQLAILYSKRHEKDREIAILERFARAPHAPGTSVSKLLARLSKKKAADG